MNKEQLQSKIASLQKAIASKATSDVQKAAMKKQVEKFEAQLAELEAKPADEKPECTDTPEKKEPAKEVAKPKVKKKITAENKAQAIGDCEEVVKELKSQLAIVKGNRKPKKKSEPARVKRTSEILADGIAAVIMRTIKRELTLDKVVRIRVDKLREARDFFSKGLVCLRAALGGISKDNDTFIDDFEKQINDGIAQVEEKQKDAEQKQAA